MAKLSKADLAGITEAELDEFKVFTDALYHMVRMFHAMGKSRVEIVRAVLKDIDEDDERALGLVMVVVVLLHEWITSETE